MSQQVQVVGAGLVGSLLAGILQKRGYEVDLLEKRSDPRKAEVYGGRSINLALSYRGLEALELLELSNKAKELGIPMRGRVIHEANGETNFQPYSKSPKKFIYSISRKRLNELLLDEAERLGVKIRFDTSWKEGEGIVFGADGTNSAVRETIKENDFTEEPLSHWYKEVEFKPVGGDYAFEQFEALHIWPRKEFMLIALPNQDKSFTGTLFMPHDAQASNELERDPVAFFKTNFPDALEKLPDLAQQFTDNPKSILGTQHNTCWAADKKMILGDAAHAIVPFYGQGMNAGFEDCDLLDQALDSESLEHLDFLQFSNWRKRDTEAISEMALENFEEMKSGVIDERFLTKKRISQHFLETRMGWISKYEKVTFSSMPYREIQRRVRIQDEELEELLNSYSEKEILERWPISTT
jgi:kynurenine 3-monooxygenase